MKNTVLSLGAFALLQIVSAQPHGARHAHQLQHEKRDEVVTVVNTVYASPSEVPEVMVIVDQWGNVVSAVTSYVAAATPTSTYVAPSSSSVVYAQAAAADSTSVWSETPTPTPSSSSAPSSSSTSSAAAASSAAPMSGGNSGFSLTYSPYHSDSSCKSQDDVNKDFELFGNDYSMVRTYGTDCDQTATVLSAAKSYGMKLFAGIFDMGSLSDEIDTIIAAANGDWSSFHTIAIGNELVNSGTYPADAVVGFLQQARSQLSSAGYTGYVVTVDTLVAMRSNPTLCDNSDYCAANCHPFFDGNVVASDSGSFLQTQIPTLAAVLADPNQTIVITETGWPSQGETNGAAVPSLENQQAAISSIKSTYESSPSTIILFTPYNNYWQTSDASQFDAEQYWGFLGDAPSG